MMISNLNFILTTLLSRNSELGFSTWNELKDKEEKYIYSFVRTPIKTIEEYANAGFSYLQSRFDETEMYSMKLTFLPTF